MGSMTHLTLAYPISANRYWATRVIKVKGTAKYRPMTYVTPEAEQYRGEVEAIAAVAGLSSATQGRVLLHVQLYPNRPQDWARRARKEPHTWDDSVMCIDLGNCGKVLSDALNGIAWADDKQLRRIVLERTERTTRARGWRSRWRTWPHRHRCSGRPWLDRSRGSHAEAVPRLPAQ